MGPSSATLHDRRTPAATQRMLDELRAQLLAPAHAVQHRSGTTAGDTAPEHHIAAERYFDAAIHAAEVQTLFRGRPLIVAHASELAAGQVMAHDGYGLPLLIARDAQGAVRCFLNVCRHRGMRLLEDGAGACDRSSLVCRYHGWTYRLDGTLRHMPHAETFDACAEGARDLVALPCVERHGLIWVLPQRDASLDLEGFLQGLGSELDFLGVADLVHFRTITAEYDANWKLIVDAFLESLHIRILHSDTIYPFFTDGVAASSRFGPHIYSLVARRKALPWAEAAEPDPGTVDDLCRISTPSHVIFPNTITVFHPDYLSLITVYPVAPERFRWMHRMLIPRAKSGADWLPHWEKTFNLIEEGVFQKEDIHCAMQIQRGLRSGANAWMTAGRMERGVGWFHDSVREAIGL